jgi:hypothetical protein
MLRFAVLAAIAACRVSTSTPIDQLADPTALAACSHGDLKANLQIVADLRDSYHEMIVCGGLALDLTSALTNVIVNVALGRGGPPQLAYRGNGTFVAGNGMMVTRVGLVGAGDVPFDPLDPQSYLVGVTVDASGAVGAALQGGSPLQVLGRAASSLTITFQGQGPGFAVLRDVLAQTSGRLSIDPDRIAKAIAAHLTIANRIDVHNDQGGTTIHYLLDGAPAPLADVLAGKKVPMQLTSIEASRGATGQTIRITEWTMQYRGDGGRVLDGTIAMDIDGGAFPYAVKLVYPHRAEPDVTLACR